MKAKCRMIIEKCIMKSGIQNSDYGKGGGDSGYRLLTTEF